MEPAAVAQEELVAQKRLLEKLSAPQFDPRPVQEFICRAKKVPNLTTLANRPNGVFGHMSDAWSLMTARTIGVEVGSVKRPNGASQCVFEFRMGEGDRLSQAVHCPLIADSPTCRFLDDPQVPRDKQWVNPASGQPIPGDLERISLYSCVVRHRWSSFPMHIDVRMGGQRNLKGVNAVQQQDELDRIYKAAGALEGGFMSITKTDGEGIEVDNTPVSSVGTTHAPFVRTMALIDRSNIENGILCIPRDVCLAARLPIFKGTPEPTEDELLAILSRLQLEDSAEGRQKLRDLKVEKWQEDRQKFKGKDISCYYAVPVMHVLAWCLHSEDYCQQHQIFREMLRFVPHEGADPVALYFLVNDVQYHSMLQSFFDDIEGPAGKIDVRPLSEVSFEFVPYTDAARYPNELQEGQSIKGVVALRAHLTYMMPPQGLTAQVKATLAPTLAPGFISSAVHVDDEAMREMALERHVRSGKK